MGDVEGGGHIQGTDADRPPAGEADAVPKYREDGEHDHEGQVTGDDQEANRGNGHHFQSLDLLVDFHGAKLGGHGGSAPSDHDNGDEERSEFAQQAERDEIRNERIGAQFAQLRGGLHGEDEANAQGHQAGHGQGLHSNADHLTEGKGRRENPRIGQSPKEKGVNPGIQGDVALPLDAAEGVDDEFQGAARAWRASASEEKIENTSVRRTRSKELRTEELRAQRASFP